MRIHILGICGTFMGSLAVLAKQLGYEVSGSDANVYPPMSTQLEAQGIELRQGYSAANLKPTPDLVVIGNTMSRGNPAVEQVLNSAIPFCSGPEWLARYLLKDRWVLGVAGTHGKTTTSAMLAWILQFAGLQPGYLIGGVARNFPSSASLGKPPFFVVEADEYDTAFFDKRSKFIHYAPRTAILNNLEYDHGDIFPDLAAIQTQFQHLVRTIPGNGLIIHPLGDANIDAVLDSGCWTTRQQFSVGVPYKDCKRLAANGRVFWNAAAQNQQGSHFTIMKYGGGAGGSLVNQADVIWNLTGMHNVSNGLAAVAAAHHAGVEVKTACAALNSFAGVKRRMELCGEINHIYLYDDFAHHPTAIATTLQGIAAELESETGPHRLIAVIEPRSNTMKMGIHQQALAVCAKAADLVIWRRPDTSALNLEKLVKESSKPALVFDNVEQIVGHLVAHCAAGDRVVIMSNGGFEGIHERLLTALRQKYPG
ncbi:MAG: UDP-N-acetylmuramate:L-alanyl-gamma-D-glutamyl-meso-diaminopimelate ligase [Pseudohongiellaceae bacterium]